MRWLMKDIVWRILHYATPCCCVNHCILESLKYINPRKFHNEIGPAAPAASWEQQIDDMAVYYELLGGTGEDLFGIVLAVLVGKVEGDIDFWWCLSILGSTVMMVERIMYALKCVKKKTFTRIKERVVEEGQRWVQA